MATESSAIQRKNQRAPPPRRGNVKAAIFRSLVKTVVSTLAAKYAREEADSGGSGSVSPAKISGETSDGNSDA